MGFSKVSMISYDHAQTCVAESINQYQVSPTGELYKCVEVFKPFERVGRIDEYGGEVHEERYFQWMSKDVFSDSECSSCKVLSLCWGGCQAAKFKYGQKECSEIKYTLRDFIIEECGTQTLRLEPCADCRSAQAEAPAIVREFENHRLNAKIELLKALAEELGYKVVPKDANEDAVEAALFGVEDSGQLKLLG